MKGSSAPLPPARARTAYRLSLAFSAIFLCFAADERFFGVISDEQQMLSTACAIATSGSVGISRDFPIQRTDRPGGDAASWYGLAQSLVEVPAMIVAGPWERLFGSRSSQTLFVLTEIAVILLAAAAAGRLARAAGAPPAGEAIAVLGTAVASPLATYASSGYSEPLQAAALAGAAMAAALAARAGEERRCDRLAAFSGALAGVAVLAKVTNLATAPFVLLPLVLDRTGSGPRRPGRRVALAAAGALPVLAVWVAGEVSRFGGLFRTYARNDFSHPLLDGAWRLLVGPNEGLFVYFPLSLAAVAGIVMLSRQSRVRGIGFGTAGVLAVLLFTSARWWWWDGTVGFGPRFLVPAMPLLAAAAGAAVPTPGAARVAVWVLVAVGVPLNALGFLQNDAVTTLLVERSNPVSLTAPERARLPRIVLKSASPRTGRFPRSLFRGDDADFASIRLHAKLLAVHWTTAPGYERDESLHGFPWSPRQPPLDRPIGISPPDTPAFAAERSLLGPFRWPIVGRALFASRQDRTSEFNAAWQLALADQVARAFDTQSVPLAERLASRLWSALPTPVTTALYAESLRLAGKRDEALRLLGSAPERTRSAPSVLVVRALIARDEGIPEVAAGLLSAVGGRLHTSALDAALASPPAEWPATYRELMGGARQDRPDREPN